MRAIVRSLALCVLVLAGCSERERAGGAMSGSATLEGTVSGAGETLVVEVPGGPGTITDGSGGFVLAGVPAGAAALHFKGATVDATLAIPVVLAGEYRRLYVTVLGGAALEHHAACETEFRGAIEAIDAAAKVITVSARKVAVTDATELLEGDAPATFADLAVEQRVEVRGTLQADGSVAARSVRILLGTGPADDPNALLLAGTLVARDGANLTVSGLPVDASGAEIWKGEAKATLDDLVLGDRLLVRGTFQGGVIVASVVRVLCREGEPPEHHVSGKVTAVDAAGHTFTVGDTVVTVDGETEWEGAGDPSLETLVIGDLVDAEVVTQGDGALLAKEVRVCAAPPEADVAKVFGRIVAVVTDAGSESVTLSRREGGCDGEAEEVKLAVTPDTRIMRGDVAIALADLVVGEPALARATREADGSLTAVSILVTPPCPIEVHGAVGAVDAAAGSVVIGETTLLVDAETSIRRGWTAIALADLVAGEPAVALAVRGTDGKLTARVIQVWPPKVHHD